ncbi:hypothetical protein BH10PLA2_BH10PLA2_09020 [soil metagenome]
MENKYQYTIQFCVGEPKVFNQPNMDMANAFSEWSKQSKLVALGFELVTGTKAQRIFVNFSQISWMEVTEIAGTQ